MTGRPLIPLGNRWLLLLAAGAVLAALPLGPAVGALGASFAAVALLAVRPDVEDLRKRFATAASFAAGWGVLTLLDVNVWPHAAALVAFVLTAGALAEVAVLNAWSYATGGWRATRRVAAVVYGASLLVAVADAVAGPGSLLDGSIFVGRVGPGLLALPVVLVVRAAGLSARDQAQANQEQTPVLAGWAAGRVGPGVVAALLLLPVWLLAPLLYHHRTTPSWGSLASHDARWQPPVFPLGLHLVETARGDWLAGQTVDFRGKGDAPFPRESRSAGTTFELTVSHGASTLLRLRQEVLATLDTERITLRGARVRTLELTTPAGFHVRVLTRLDIDVREPGAGGSATLRVPFVVYVQLLSGSGPSTSTVERVRGLPRVAPVDVAGVSPPALPWFAQDLRTWVPLVSSPPVPKDGLRYLAAFRGQLELKGGRLSAPRRLSGTIFKANTLAYSYVAELAERAAAQDTGGKKSVQGRTTWDYELRWRGRTW